MLIRKEKHSSVYLSPVTETGQMRAWHLLKNCESESREPTESVSFFLRRSWFFSGSLNLIDFDCCCLQDDDESLGQFVK